VKILVISSSEQFIDAQAKQFALRGRPCLMVGPEQCRSNEGLSALLASADIGMVVNSMGLESLSSAKESVLEPVTLLVKACASRGLPMLQLSGSQVFDGLDGGRHREEEPATPASRAGALLWRMEKLVREAPRHLILRTAPIYSALGDNLLTRLLADFRRGGAVERSTGGQCCPTWAGDLARVISAIVDQISCDADCWGTYHYTSSDPVSNYQFAESTLAVASQFLDTEALGLSLEIAVEMDVEWPRPLLNCEKIRNTFGIKQMPWRSSISSVVQQVFDGEEHEQSHVG
jgi:dTDP-4-dehydrorhamnose reductase